MLHSKLAHTSDINHLEAETRGLWAWGQLGLHTVPKTKLEEIGRKSRLSEMCHLARCLHLICIEAGLQIWSAEYCSKFFYTLLGLNFMTFCILCKLSTPDLYSEYYTLLLSLLKILVATKYRKHGEGPLGFWKFNNLFSILFLRQSFPVWPRLSWTSQVGLKLRSTCLSLPSVGIKGMQHHCLA